MKNRKITVGTLEFDQIKVNLIEFLRGQDEFMDFDFEGSNLNQLIEILAYNTYYNSIYTNLAVNEVFLDSASKRESVVSLAKSLGYLPRSARCSEARVSFKIINVPENPHFITLPKHTVFSSVKNDIRYTFYTNNEVSRSRNELNEYVFNDIALYEGAPVRNTFVYNGSNSFILPNIGIDINTIRVRVQNPPSSEFQVFTYSQSIAKIDSKSPVFFLKESSNIVYEIMFGDGVVGKQLANGQIIYVDYFVSSGDEPNGIAVLSYSGDPIAGGTLSNLVMSGHTFGGRLPEEINSIKFNAPRSYTTQNRAVTSSDYEAILREKVPIIEDVIVWGGESMIPPVYGKVFISANTHNNVPPTNQEQEFIKNFILKNYNMITVIPEFVEPNYINIILDVVVYYDSKLTVLSSQAIRTLVIENIQKYNRDTFGYFKKIFRKTDLIRVVESTEQSITSCVPRVKFERSFIPVYNSNFKYNILIGNPILAGSVRSCNFFIFGNDLPCYFNDDSNGGIDLYHINQGIHIRIKRIGSVDYSRGNIVIDKLRIVNVLDAAVVRISAEPTSSDIVGMFNQIVRIDDSKTKVAMISEETHNGTYKGTDYNFTTTRI